MVDLAGLLTSAPARHALARRDITTVFRTLRDAGINQASIALATGQGQSEISEIISGRQVQSVVLLERIADGLGVPRGWMGLAYATGAQPVEAIPEDPKTEQDSNANLLRHAATVLYGKPVFGPADPIRVRESPTPMPRRIGLAEVGQVQVTTDRLGELLGNLGGIPMTSALTAHARASEALLGTMMREPVRQQLLVALSDAHRTAGGAAFGAGLPDLACQHFIRGMDCAGAAGDQLRAVVSLGCMELDIEPNEALKLFPAGHGDSADAAIPREA